ncbi:MAG: 3-oxoacyl-[acyl-carrier-protein] reductase [Candidatus Cloacimonetes bacterium]|nr:3-oxoacyl-[acyl-carrier-protein] reductase [Candidatus Cloacimonadota bacterium]HOA29120.1 3-oxoacyl-[acyl-carrier-protein] reductase [Candidatus Cloacimonadota bacterium]HPI25778.1 3-oxoacyl-[acyl-carrier-protein] reductase [Candidatus Cloacimonadota bacterium]
MMYDLKDKVVLITGSARGIGFTIAERFAHEQALVLILDLAQEAVDNAVAKLRGQGGNAFGYVANVTDTKGVEELFARIVSEHGRIDVLINNAGVTRDNLMIRMKEEEWDLVLNINLKGTFICTQKVFKHMMKARSGSIINISSVIGIMGNSGQANYAASKGGMIAFTKSCAKEFASRGIRVNAIAPGFIETEMTATLSDEIRAEYAKVIPMSKMGTPADVAKLCLFLASEESSYITGQTIAVDGGLTMH